MFSVDPPQELMIWRGFTGCEISGRVVSPLKEDSRGRKLIVDGWTMRGRQFEQKIQVYLPKNSRFSPRPGQPVELHGRLRLPRPARNPGEFDEKTFLHDRGVSWILKAETVQPLGPPSPAWRLKAWAEDARQSFEAYLRRVLPRDEARVFAGLTMGYKGPLRRDWNRMVQDAGVMHLLVPSGAKVAFVMLAAWALTLRLGLRPAARLAAMAAVGGFYTLMVGADAPYTRAFWGGLALGVCQLRGRESGAFQAMTLAAAVTLAWEPRELFSAGFQMTYAAVFGLVLAMPSVQAASRGLPSRWRGALAMLAGSFIVQLMLWPIFANTFGRGSLAGVLANLILIPASGLMMAAGFIAWLAGAWSTACDAITGAVLGTMARMFMAVCGFFSALPGAAVDLCPMNAVQVSVYYGLALALLMAPRWKAVCVLLAASLSLWIGSAVWERWERPALRVLLLRLPPAYPAVARFSDGQVWLIDPGSKISAVARALRDQGVRRVDRLVLTAPLSRRAWRNLRARVPFSGADRVDSPLRLCRGEVCFELGGPEGPRVLRGRAQYSIIPGRLRLGAVEIATDGHQALIR
jgi:competence protein ComEC